MKKLFAVMRAHRKVVYVLLVLVCLVNGIGLAYAAFRGSMDMGDSSTFYAMARSAANGEVPFKDFIHFRTPGTIGLHTLFLKIFGEQQSSSVLATYIETLLLFPLLVAISAMILFRKRHPIYVVVATLGAMFASGAAQLRAGFGLLAVACYIASFDSPKHQKRYLWAAGILTGVTFIFGQEVALMVGLCILAGEIIGRKRDKWWPRLRPLLLGGLLGVLPLLAYILVFSNFGTFIYYVTYYSFVLQPKGMDVPFPAFSYESLLFYLPFILYGLCFWVLYASRTLGKVEGLLLSFGILRLITALGRADTGHLMFSIPEVFVITPLILHTIKDTTFSKRMFRSFAPYGVALVALFVLSMIFSGIFLVFVPFLILWALYKRPKTASTKSSQQTALNMYLAVGVCLALIVYLIFPVYKGLLQYAKQSFVTRHNPEYRIGGVKFEPVVYQEINEVKAVVDPMRPNTIFAFPIQPFYYTLAPHHAARYLTFEPQTTVDEQDKTIEDLKRTKPEVVIFDPLQAHGLSGSLWRISDYITENYEIKEEIAHREILWVMTPKTSPARDDKLAFQLYKDNKDKKTTNGVQNKNMNIENGVLQQTGTIHFIVDADNANFLKLSVSTQPDLSACGMVTIKYGASESSEKQVCTKDGEVALPLKPNAKNIRIELEDKAPSAIMWNNPRITD